MNKKSTWLAAAAGTLLVAGLCQTAQANLTDTLSTSPGFPSAANITVVSSYTDVAGLYTYSYNLTTTANVGEFSVFFPTSAPGAVIPGTVVGGTAAPSVLSQDVTWNFNPEMALSGVTVSFESFLPPSLGIAAALDSTDWGINSGPVYVPLVPDGGLTVALLGGSLLAVQALRRKLVS
jgi:hypothetical protein